MLSAICYVVPFPIYLALSFVIVTLEHSDRYLAAAGATAVEMLVLVCGLVLPGIGPLRAVERWAAGHEVDAATALEATYTWARGAIIRGLAVIAVCGVVLAVVVGVIAGASEPRLVQYAVWGLAVGVGSHLIGVHSVPEIPMRPRASHPCGSDRHRRFSAAFAPHIRCVVELVHPCGRVRVLYVRRGDVRPRRPG